MMEGERMTVHFQKVRCAIADWVIKRLCPGMFFYDPGENPFSAIDKEGGTPLGAAAATTLVYRCVDAGVHEIQVTFQGVERDMKPCGDWVVIVRRVSTPKEG